MKKIKYIIIIMFVLFLSACQFQQNDDLSITLFTERHYDTDQLLYDEFTERTGIKVNLVRDEADKLMTRLTNEGENTEADLLIIADAGRLGRAKEQDLLRPVTSDVLDEQVPSNYKDPESYWYGLTMRARVLVYHPERVNASELSTYEALTDAKWQGRIVTRSSTNIYNQSLMASFIELWGEDQALSFAEGLVQNFARDPQGNDRDQAKAVVSGEADVAIMNTYYIGRMLYSSDPEEVNVAQTVNIFFPNQDTTGTHINVSGIGLVKHSKNQELALKLMEFLTSEDAQSIYADANFEYPVNPNVEPHELLLSWGTFIKQDIALSVLSEHSTKATMLMNQAGWK
ncbi:MAG: Fe(3+) ABC transporter substrate-binding protein [Tenericutes bacterium GWC2_34_14]|nr:MAG: Fe(3+) ABC transporter substrate-binding protein [Tenericutes bacterium GWA2_35_7]OHE29929.1 MAG: Fe(3+) ABC transporter substrate-binding protein [Tenericutes bacterium GWC2_34_14]OHE34908.1 MAG: Fe(3+) ABC transporter substrate-binding protein [Tenericutes bacterium GWE2_34_108]OHE37232.1 MAG: Fe(3+) ABC transporter substrate-binding protein [Tenericutes bacterium GWF1_35_14]OHE39636.1 MAG: Fe(3+) ABC transporter substrate-binding protein [Tenericutes bacterium GWF2_35_184]OHE44176.1